MLSVFGLVVLLLLSPCKVRHFIQAEIGVAQSETLNKSQSTISTFGCETLEVADTLQKSSAKKYNFSKGQLSEAYKHGVFEQPEQVSPLLNSQEILRVSTVPLYILYRNLKVYS